MTVFSQARTDVAQQVAARTVAATRDRYAGEVQALLAAALAVLQREGAANTTVAAVLAEAGLSTRAFYRHFASKDELLLAVYAAEAEAAAHRLRERIAAAPDPRAALDAWIDDALSFAFSSRRATRTRALLAEGRRLESVYPGETDRIVLSQLAPLVDLLERGRADGTFPDCHPHDDARTIYAVVFALVTDRLKRTGRGRGALASLEAARAHVARFVLPALTGGAP